TICREVRKFDPQIPIIMLTAKDTESDEVIGLELGADDYVTKPFSPLTLVARIKSTVRRVETPGEAVQTNSNYDIDTENLKINKKYERNYFIWGTVRRFNS